MIRNECLSRDVAKFSVSNKLGFMNNNKSNLIHFLVDQATESNHDKNEFTNNPIYSEAELIFLLKLIIYPKVDVDQARDPNFECTEEHMDWSSNPFDPKTMMNWLDMDGLSLI